MWEAHVTPLQRCCWDFKPGKILEAAFICEMDLYLTILPRLRWISKRSGGSGSGWDSAGGRCVSAAVPALSRPRDQAAESPGTSQPRPALALSPRQSLFSLKTHNCTFLVRKILLRHRVNLEFFLNHSAFCLKMKL